MDISPYAEVEENYRKMISRQDEADKRFNNDIANKREEFPTEKLEKQNRLELQVKTLNSKFIESEYDVLGSLLGRQDDERDALHRRHLKEFREYEAHKAQRTAKVQTEIELLRINLQVEVDHMITTLENDIEQQQKSQGLKKKDEKEKWQETVLKVVHKQTTSSPANDTDPSNPAQYGHDRASSFPPCAAAPTEFRPRKAASGTKPMPALQPIYNDDDDDDSDGPLLVELLNDSRRRKASESRKSRPPKKMKLDDESEITCLEAQKVNSNSIPMLLTFDSNDMSGNTASLSLANIQEFQVQHLQFVDRDPESNILKSISEWHSSRFEPCISLRLHGDSFRPYTNKYCDDEQPDWVIDTRSVVELLCNPNNALVSMKRVARQSSSSQWHSRDVWVQFKDVQNMEGFVKCCRGKRAGELLVIKQDLEIPSFNLPEDDEIKITFIGIA